jgi:hypothetical protein
MLHTPPLDLTKSHALLLRGPTQGRKGRATAAGEVLVKVRVSKSGNAIPQSGDLAGSMGPVKVGAQGLKLEIKDLVP